MGKKRGLLKMLEGEIKSFAWHCLLFRSTDVKDWMLGICFYATMALLIYGVYNLIALSS